MIFVINKLKYDTDKMTLISEKCQYRWLSSIGFTCLAKEVMLWKSEKGNWLLTYRRDLIHPFSGRDLIYPFSGKALTESEAMDLLLKYDIDAYEKLFGELEEV